MPMNSSTTYILLVVGLISLYLYILDKKGKKLKETEDGTKEYVDKYFPERLKYKSKTVGNANTRQRMSKKDRRKFNREEKEEN